MQEQQTGLVGGFLPYSDERKGWKVFMLLDKMRIQLERKEEAEVEEGTEGTKFGEAEAVS